MPPEFVAPSSRRERGRIVGFGFRCRWHAVRVLASGHARSVDVAAPARLAARPETPSLTLNV
jgi:hypothetical protein